MGPEPGRHRMREKLDWEITLHINDVLLYDNGVVLSVSGPQLEKKSETCAGR